LIVDPPTLKLPEPGPSATVPLVAVKDADPAKFGELVVPLPDSDAELVAIE
jgi:hypothetical protein